MVAKYILPALAAIGSVAAQAGTCTASGGTTTIDSAAAATGLASCRTVRGSVVITRDAGAEVVISGPSQITGDLKVEDNDVIKSLSSNDLTIIGGSFLMDNVTQLSALNLPSLTRVKSLSWTTLNALDIPAIGPPGIVEAEDVLIQDTFLSSLAGIDVASLRTMKLVSNRRLSTFTTQLGNVSDELIISANGLELEVSMPNLKWIANMTIANVTQFSVPSLHTVNGSARFDFNFFGTFNAPNLTSTKSGDISFVGNSNLNNISIPLLTSIGGGLLIANNTNLADLDGFPKLKQVGGAIKLRGSFKELAFPALNDVKGAFDTSSTEDISTSCEAFKKLAPARSGGGGQIQGTYKCESNNEDANKDTGTGTGEGSDKSAASGLMTNSALLGLVGVFGLAQAFL